MTDIIIPHYNTPELLNDCVQSIIRHTKDHSIIIVDNNSDKASHTVLSELGKIERVRVVRNNRNMGYAYANNQGIKLSTAENICFLNSDTVVTPHWLERLLAIKTKNRTSAISCMTDYVDDANQLHAKIPEGTSIDDHAESLYKAKKDAYEDHHRVIGFCILMDRASLKVIGDCFDTRFETGGFEDDDICYRLREHELRVGIAKGVFIRHVGSQTFKTFTKQKIHDTFISNREAFQNKWTPQRLKRMKFSRLDIVYVIETNCPCGGVKVVFEHANRLHDRGHNVSIIARQQWTSTDWFGLNVPVTYGGIDSIPACDIAVATFYTTIPAVMKSQARVKIHLSQGYEGLYQDAETVKKHYQMAENTICVSKWLQSVIMDKTGKAATYIKNGLDPYVYSFKTHNINITRPRVLVVGEELEIKNTRTVLSALSKLKNRIDVVRMFSGKDPLYESYKMPDMTQHEIAAVYDSCDILVSASKQVEGFGLPPLEAMASGCMVITTDNGGNKEYIKPGHNCLLIDGSEDSIISAIQKILGNPSLANELPLQGLETAKQYKWDTAIDNLEEHFMSLADTTSADEFDPPETIAIYKTFRGDEFLIPSIESIYPYCKKIVLVHCSKSWTGQEGNSCADAVEEWLKTNDKQKKIISQRADISDQTEAYELAWKLANKHKHEWKMMIDTDEVWDNRNIRLLMRRIKNETCGIVRTKTHYYVKSPEFQMWPQCPMTPVVMVRSDIPYTPIRLCTEGAHTVYWDVFYHHFSLVRRTLEECIAKQDACNTAENVDLIKWDKWIKLKWDMMPFSLHDNEQFRKILFADLPETMKTSKLAMELFEKYHVDSDFPEPAITPEILKKYGLPADFSQRHPDFKVPSKRNRYKMAVAEVLEATAVE